LDGLVIILWNQVECCKVDQDFEQVTCTLGVYHVDKSQVGDQLERICSTPNLTEGGLQ